MNDTKGAIKVLNELQANGVIGKYAIGGAVAATFYPIEPASTLDIDVFISFECFAGSLIASPGKLYEYLIPRGYGAFGEHFLINGWQVQFLPAEDPLLSEALDLAIQKDVGDVKTWVMKAEHLMAIALRLGRAKDLIRIEQFVHHAAYNPVEYGEILNRHNLVEKWQKFNDKYMGDKK